MNTDHPPSAEAIARARAAAARHPGLARRPLRLAIAIGVAGIVIALIAAVAGAGLRRFCAAYLVGFSFALSIPLGALFFVLLQHLTHAGWSVPVRRLAETAAATLPACAILFLPVLFSMGALYPWTGEVSELVAAKRAYLNPAFFVVRWILYFAVWSALALAWLRRSTAQDRDGDPAHTAWMERFSGPAMVLYGFTVTFAAIDLLMSLEPEWFSSIFGVYYFSGAAVAIFAVLPLALFALRRSGRLIGAATVEHDHDLGKFLFGFAFFWSYIAFSQYLLIWYASLPEETVWYYQRQQGGWAVVAIVLLAGHFVLPFLGLLPRAAKRTPRILGAWSAWLLVMHAVDLYWIVIPSFSPDRAMPGIVDVAALVGVAGVWTAAWLWIAARFPLAPIRDPRFAESIDRGGYGAAAGGGNP